MKGRSNLDQRNSKMAPYIFIIVNTYASSMCSRVSYPFQIYSSYTCGQAKTVRKRKANFFENGEKKLRFQTNTDTCGQGLRNFGRDKMVRR